MTKSVFALLFAWLTLLAPLPPAAWADGGKSHVCFRTLDADHNSRVTWDEFHHGYPDYDRDKYQALDVDRDGELSHEEYHRALERGYLKK